MRYWGYLVALLYIIMLVAVGLPVLMACFEISGTVREVFMGALSWWGFWLWIGILLIAELVLLTVPVQALNRRPTPQRPVKAAIWMTAILLALVTVLGIATLVVACGGDGGVIVLEFTCPMMLILWIWWAILFYKRLTAVEASEGFNAVPGWLLKGSIMELLIAVPCHVLIRQRGDCCAPFVTGIGISAGISVMLLAFGPGVLFLYIERRRRLQPRAPTATCSDASCDATTNTDN